MVYNWEGKEAECYRLYVEERKSLDEVIEHWGQRGFTPSKRAFQTQFKRWDFPRKQNPAHKNPALVARVKELWENNVTQRDMVEMLMTEGFEINDRELMRLRLRFNWLLRESRGRGVKRKDPGTVTKQRPQKKKKQKVVRGNGIIDQLANAILQDSSSSEESEHTDEEHTHHGEDERPPAVSVEAESQAHAQLEALDPAEVHRRQLRQEQLQQESAEKWRTRKRRRRTRGWAGLPADAPGEPPRFPSETTLDESKAYLHLDNQSYREVREQFRLICNEHAVTKKTIAGPEKWGRIIAQLIRDNAHLSSVFQEDAQALQDADTMWRARNYKALSLDVICLDVTKRMRTLDTRMSLAEAKNTLGLNPQETRQARSQFHVILKADHFTNKFAAGEEHWNALKRAWIEGSELLTRVLVGGDADPRYAQKVKAVEVLARDVMKRLRSETLPKDPDGKKQAHQGPGPGPAPPSMTPHASKTRLRGHELVKTSSSAATDMSLSSAVPASSAPMDLQIDPSLLLAASDASVLPHHHSTHLLAAQPSRPQTHPHHPSPYATTNMPTPPPPPLPIYFRLHPLSLTPQSQSQPHPPVWLRILQTRSMSELRRLATSEHRGAAVLKIEGLLVHRVESQPLRQEVEVAIAVEDEHELGAYLQLVGGAGGKPVFVVVLGW
ncbi:hypothetical protein BDV95DRAFT_500026 [Massariosphaeria phaeospora]|uniref:Uncharacterized protein n=1 Tax=Massariosphaeria phaeospora TaxID=100035 RepID=A0A7C8M4P1_9PLEO|nr:hypothetical protein BDV95DRAFT_500026 [Massariosphaeria phaeospora]